MSIGFTRFGLLLAADLLALTSLCAQDVRRLYDAAELEFQKGNYSGALSYIRQIESVFGRPTPRVHALKTKVLDSDGRVFEAKLAIEEFFRMANPATRSSEGYADMPALKARIDRALNELERRWPQELQKRRMEEADQIIQQMEAERERKIQAKRVAAAQFEVREWQAITQENAADGYKSFAERYPNSSRVKEARSRAEAASFREAERENTAAAFRAFLDEYPGSIFALKAQERYEELLYLDVLQRQTPEAYRSYLEAFPRGRYAHTLRQRLALLEEDEVFTEAKNELSGSLHRYYGFLRYLRKYPRGKHADEAQREVEIAKIQTPPAATDLVWFEHYVRGVEEMQKGEHEAAAARFLRAIDLRERDGQNISLPDGRRVDYFPHRELGICLAELGILDFAREELQLSLSYIWTLRAQQAFDALGK